MLVLLRKTLRHGKARSLLSLWSYKWVLVSPICIFLLPIVFQWSFDFIAFSYIQTRSQELFPHSMILIWAKIFVSEVKFYAGQYNWMKKSCVLCCILDGMFLGLLVFLLLWILWVEITGSHHSFTLYMALSNLNIPT